MNFIKKNLAMIVGITLPFLFIIILLVVVMLPTLSLQPMHNFVYVTGDRVGYSYPYQVFKYSYTVVDGKINLASVNPNAPVERLASGSPTLFLYNVTDASSHEISFADAQKLSLDPGPTSSDGYTVGYKYNNDGIISIFGGGGSQGYFVSKGDKSRRLTGLGNENGSAYDFKLIGWVN